MAELLIERLSAEITLIPSSGGVFEVSVNGQLIYSKKASGVFPDQEKLLMQIQEHATPS
ncbi:MAG: hypothetical protein C0624_13115 [Desulfuromonas sp.]|nr:MAG: hypothetical protein C0624_13115 [Desulfuromonas sp.]